MKYLKDETFFVDADSAEDISEPTIMLENRAGDLRQQLLATPGDRDPRGRADLLLESSRVLLRLEKAGEAWAAAREAFDLFLSIDGWEGAIQACDVLFAADQPDSLAALGQGVWLAVSFPVDPELSVALLEHIIEETPDDSQGAAVAAITAHYVVDMRAPEGKLRENLLFYTNRLLVTVARRLAKIEEQKAFDQWFKSLELDDPAKFLPRLRNIVDVLVQDQWWFDRAALQSRMPVN
ncbi:MAG: hypothetical protein AAB329_01290 [Pseudomonadota bacterium]